MSVNQKKGTNPNAKLSILERIAYGLGDFSGNLIYSSISGFLLVYYVSVLGVDAGVAASIMAVSKLLDGVSDLIMGRIVDKTHTKWGKARPWILRMSFPLAICFVLMFSVPSSLAGSAQVAYMFLTYNLVSTIFYTGLNVPYSTLQGLMTTNQYERGLLGNFRMLLATAGTMAVNTFVMKLTPYQGTNFDRKTAFHFGGLFFYLWPEMLEIAAFSGGFLFLGNMAVASKTGLLFTKSIKVVAVSFDLNTFITSACSRNAR